MSTEQGNASKKFLGEEVALARDGEEEGEPGTPKGSSFSSSDGTSHPQSKLQIEDVISVASNAAFLSSPLQQQSAVSLPSTPPSVVPATIDMLLRTGAFQLVLHGQDINSAPHNEQLPLSAPAAMVNAGTTSNLFTELRLKPPSQPITPTSILERLDKIQGWYQKMANNSGFAQHGPQPGAAYPNGSTADHQVLSLTVSNEGIPGLTWRALTESEILEDELPRDPKAAGKETDRASDKDM